MINTHQTIFKINNQKQIIIQFPYSLDNLNPCSELSILFLHKDKKICLTKDFLYHNISKLSNLLKKALNTELLLHSSITQDIGYLFNQYSAYVCGENIEQSISLAYDEKNHTSYWPGNNYHLWSQDFISWIYNAPDKSIILEITPFYPYMYCEPEEEPDYIPYHEWIKTYKPYLVQTIPREIAQQWLTQAEHIINTIEDNVKKWKMENDNKNI